MGDLAGWVLLGIVVLVFAYILPTAIRSRQVVVDSRVEDRYSGDLRIVATAGHRPVAITSTSRVFVHARRTTEEGPMSSVDRQLAASDARRLAAARAARAAAASRRAAAASRRLALTVLLLLVTAGAWAGFALLSWPVVAAVLASLALVGVVLLGRRAAAAGSAADARWEREMSSILAHSRERSAASARQSGRPRLRMDVDPTALLSEPVRAAESPRETPRVTADPKAWTPVAVPPPAYTLKQSAPRREVSPLVMEQATELMDAVDASDVEMPTVGEVEELPATAVEQAKPVEPSMNVQAVLARRRAAG